MNTTELSQSSINDYLIDKPHVVQYLADVILYLENDKQWTKSKIIIASSLQRLIDEAHCCITTWNDVARFYVQSSCMIRNALTFIKKNSPDHAIANGHITRLRKAHESATIYVIEQMEKKYLGQSDGDITSDSILMDLKFLEWMTMVQE
jgi:hypothetical protein